MTGNTTEIVRHLFGASSLEDVSVTELKQLVEEFPSFNAAHYLLSRKLHSMHEPGTDANFQRTALYFNNPFWMQWLMEHGDSTLRLPSQNPLQQLHEYNITQQDWLPQPETVDEENLASAALSEDNVNADVNDALQPAELENAIVETEHAWLPQPEFVNEHLVHEHETVAQSLENNSVPDEVVPVDTPHPQPADEATPEVDGFEVAPDLQPEPHAESFGTGTETPVEEAIERTAFGESLHPAAPVTEPGPPKKEEPLFDPYHTIDYFASQGIRFVPEENPKDRFGKQLKSFTDWLRVMKRLPQQPAVQTEPDARIQQFAERSIAEENVLTEAMAEVLAKQGKTQDAIDIYRKLSLLNPGKSAYFAARIDQLNAV